MAAAAEAALAAEREQMQQQIRDMQEALDSLKEEKKKTVRVVFIVMYCAVLVLVLVCVGGVYCVRRVCNVRERRGGERTCVLK